MKSIRTLFFGVFALLTLHANAAQADFSIKIYYHENPRIGNSPDTDAWIKGKLIFSQRILAEIGKPLKAEYASTGPSVVKLTIDCEVMPNGKASADATGYALNGKVSYTGTYLSLPFGASPALLMADGRHRFESIASNSIVTKRWWIFQEGHAFVCVAEINPMKP